VGEKGNHPDVNLGAVPRKFYFMSFA
jgi:hypothetical protein